MKIGIDIKAFKNGSTGIARYLENLMDELQNIDNINEYVLFSCSDSMYEIRNRNWKKEITSWKLPGIIWQQLVLPKILKKHSIDVLWSPEQIAPVVSNGGARIVTTVHDLAAFRFPESCQMTNLIIQKLLFRSTLIKSSAIIPVSSFIKNELIERYPLLNDKPMEVVTNAGPDWEIPAKGTAKERENYLFCVGNIEPRKNLVRLIKAFETIDDPDLRLVIAGPKGWKNSDFYAALESNKRKVKIEIRGYVTEEELRTHYLSCKALVYPSLYEGFGIPVLEALSMNCPVITSRGTVMEEIAGNLAVYFDPYDIEDISSTINMFLKGQDIYLKKVHNVYDTIREKYSWKKSAFQLKQIFETLK